MISGGQTGADRAALDAAIALGVPHGGWCPRGRRAEDGPIPRRYRLRQTPLARVSQRTLWNIRDSDGTLVLCHGRPRGGSALTVRGLAGCRPRLVLNPEAPGAARRAAWFVRRHRIRRLNVGGPRASEDPAIYPAVSALVCGMLIGLA